MSFTEITPNRLRYFAEMQYLAQWEQKYRYIGGWPSLGGASLSDEQLKAMYPHVDALLRSSEASGRFFLNRLDSITRVFFVEWLETSEQRLVKERHPLRLLLREDIDTIFDRMSAQHEEGNLLELQPPFVEACHFFDSPDFTMTDEVNWGGT